MGTLLRPDMMLEPRPHEQVVHLKKREGFGPGPIFKLHPIQGLILGLLDGVRSKEDITEVLAQALDLPRQRAEMAVRGIWERFCQFLVTAEEVAEDDRLFYNPMHFIFPGSDSLEISIREAAPATLVWVVTEDCDKKCRYCYKDASYVADGKPTDIGISTDRMKALIAEAQDIGVNKIILTGGEPFLRDDMVELISCMVEADFEIVPITKAHFTHERMKALAATQLEALHISLDSHDAATVDYITDVPGSFAQILDTVEKALRYGVGVILRPVLTSRNVDHLEALIDLTYAMGVRRFIVDIYGKTCGRHDPNLNLTPAQIECLYDRRANITAKYPAIDLNLYFESKSLENDYGKGCMEGVRSLTIMPQGRTTKCEHWKPDHRLDFGDLRFFSILDIWNGNQLKRINFPERKDFKGYACYKCKHLENCNYLRGRCSLTSLLHYDTVGAPDVHCPIGAFKPREASEPITMAV